MGRSASSNIIVLLLFLLTGCATVGTVRADVRSVPETSRTARYFNLTVGQLAEIATKVIRDYGLEIERQENPDPDEAIIIAKKGVSAFSWGEIVGVSIHKMGPEKTLIKIVSRRKLGTNFTAKDWTRDILSGITARASRNRGEPPEEDVSVPIEREVRVPITQDMDWLESINSAVSAGFALENKPRVAVGCDGRFGDYIAGRIVTFLSARNTNLSIIANGKDLTRILEQQKLSLMGIYDDKTAVQVGKIAGARYLLACVPYFKAESDKVELDCKLFEIESGKLLTGLMVMVPQRELPQI